ncbi:2Fe-2S iron-sulfur cluster-binding protein [Thiolapillus sp.]
MTTGLLALIIVALILLQVLVFVLIGLYRRKCQYRKIEEEGHKNSAVPESTEPVLRDTDASEKTRKDFREFRVQRRELENRDGDICSFYLTPADGQPLPAFKPGQFLTFRLSIQDPVSQQEKTIVRCYSLSDRPNPEYYRITVKRVSPPADRPELPPGLSSGYFHDQVHEGSSLMVKAPSGHFHLMEDSSQPVVLIGGGIGITPMLSMLNTLLHSGSKREIWLYYGVRNGNEQIMKEHLRSLADKHENFHLHVCYSAPLEADREGIDYQHRGWVDVPLLRDTLKLARYQFYICGPKQMMESLVPGLEEELGVDAADIFYESFGPATLTRKSSPADRDESKPAPSVTVTFSKSGKQLAWNPAAGSLLEFAEEQGIEVESGCRAGSCGCCQTRLEAGEILYNQQPDADVEPGCCLLCISTPKSDITLAA